MKACLIIIGDEILIGQVIDTNSGWIAQQLSTLGIPVVKILSIKDEHSHIIEALEQALSVADIVFMTGGLGPTKDDVTKIALAEFMGVDMYFDQAVYDRIENMFKKLGRTLSDRHRNQCLMPEGVELIRNSMGTAPGMLFRKGSQMIISMPGVPFEMKAIMTEYVLDMLKVKTDQKLFHYTIHTTCTGETIIENLISSIVDTLPDYIKIAYLPSISAVKLRLTGEGKQSDRLEEEVLAYAEKIVNILGDIVYGFNETSLENELMQLCVQKNIHVVTAESCTGGAVAARIVSLSGSSAYFNGSVVAYSNEIKNKVLGVKSDTLTKYGAVSEYTVKEMVDGVLDVLDADVAVAVSGVAGPEGGTTDHPVGYIWLCVGTKTKKETFLLKSGKYRDKNIEASVMYALDLLRRFVIKNMD